MTELAAFWRFLPGGPAPDAEAIRAAGAGGHGGLARALREARRRLGTQRTASLLRAAESRGRLGRPLTLVVAAPFQPRAVEDALLVGFAIAGFSVDLVPVDGLAELSRADVRGSDFALLPVFDDARDRIASLANLGAAFSRRSRAPALIAVIGGDGEVGPVPAGVEIARVPVAGPAVDGRFGRTFGQLPEARAADALGDAAAGFAARLKGTAPKLIVTDLDGTLWSGTLGEDHPRSMDLHRRYAGALGDLAARGVVLAIASRNDPADVEAAFTAHPGWPVERDAFSAAAVGWDEKDALVAQCLAQLGLDAEHMIVVDDDPVNCAKLAARFPQADVRLFSGDPDAFARQLAADPLLAGAATGSGDRADQYRRREAVERLRAQTPDVGAFLRALDTRLTVVPLDAALRPRAAELGARVNQFVLTDERPSALQLGQRSSPLDFMLRLDDAFGSHGLVALVLARPEGKVARVDNILLSCRALGRGVEEAMLRALGVLAGELGLARIEGRIEALARNEPARKCFSRYARPDDGRSWQVGVDAVRSIETGGVTLAWDRARI